MERETNGEGQTVVTKSQPRACVLNPLVDKIVEIMPKKPNPFFLTRFSTTNIY